jgi:hypothetical protein
MEGGGECGIEEEEELEEEKEDSILQSKYIHPNSAALTDSVTVNTNLLQRIHFF